MFLWKVTLSSASERNRYTNKRERNIEKIENYSFSCFTNLKLSDKSLIKRFSSRRVTHEEQFCEKEKFSVTFKSCRQI